MRPTQTQPKPRRNLRQWLSNAAAGGILFFAGWQIFASFLWIAPPTAMRQLVPGDLLERYMLPWFGQSWSVFAPDPINGDNEILVRAQISSDNGAATVWVSATDVEYALAWHNPFPPKAATMGAHQAASFRDAWGALNTKQREVAGRSFTNEPALERALEILGPTAVAARYLQEDERTAAYATEVAYSIWGSRVEAVQFRVQRHGIVPFASRNDIKPQRPAPVVAATGWRNVGFSFSRADDGFRNTFQKAWALYKARQ
ncbi:hypothetical protein KZI27_00085 (plasmid) [Curtobacterium sp. TC1]|uniref:DUF5819 family protein n=1 Tax=Curtobacterium sp. TC1 TaxID=2862880 RepID=UPI001C9B0194|nr:DUF5819 family protein [Curtobacterium sp. TC1]QZQ53676.1 hypothetical protein KZI27_00085 [Curtobacterium sp. TC1]